MGLTSATEEPAANVPRDGSVDAAAAAASRILEVKAPGEHVDGHTSLIRRGPIGVVGRSPAGTIRSR
jgi:hypothetical protein